MLARPEWEAEGAVCIGGGKTREKEKRDSSTPQADAFAERTRKKKSACSARNDNFELVTLEGDGGALRLLAAGGQAGSE